MIRQDELVTSNLWLAKAMAYKYRMAADRANLSMDDLASEAAVGMLEVAKRFDFQGDEGRFKAFSTFRAKGRILRFLEKNPPHRELPAFQDDDGIIPFEVADRRGNEDPSEDTILVQSLLATLSQRERFVVEQYFGIGANEPKTLKAIANELGLSGERVRQILDTALARLKRNWQSDWLQAGTTHVQ